MAKNIGFSLKNLDTSVRPQDDFFQYAGGGWLKNNPIPKSESMWGTFYVLRDDVLKKTRTIFSQLQNEKNLKKGSEAQIVRDFYLSGMDMKMRNQRGLSPLQPTLARIKKIDSKKDLFAFIFNEHKRGSHYVWRSFVGQDDKDAENYTFHLSQGGLSLPDRDYYLKTDAQSKKIRDEFVKYAETLLVLGGFSKEHAAKSAPHILDLETRFARISMSRVDCHEIEKVYNRKTVSELKRLAPIIPWKEYFKTLGVEEKVKKLTVLQPRFFEKLSDLFETVSLDIWKEYLYFDALDGAAPLLSNTFVKTSFAFRGKILAGSQAIRPLWKRVVGTLDALIGEAVGKEYVKRYFSPQAKEKIQDLVKDLITAYGKRIEAVDWMSIKTKKKALKKLSMIVCMLGYPDKWQSYKSLRVEPDTFYENVERSVAFEQKKNYRKLGKKVNRREWFIPPQTVNAFYDPNKNQIVFPAGILQPPFFDPNGDDAINYGAIGSVIGHELTHAFDNLGAKFDGHGNYKNWWTKEDRQRFDARAQVLVTQFNQYKVGDLNVNGKLTLGENIADLGGLAIAYDAFKIHMQKTKQKNAHGFTPEQRYFFGLAMFETAHARPEYARMLVMVDPHSPAKFRVNGPFSNLETFYKAFNVTEKDKLYRKHSDRAKIW